jgi:hypothetical protein
LKDCCFFYNSFFVCYKEIYFAKKIAEIQSRSNKYIYRDAAEESQKSNSTKREEICQTTVIINKTRNTGNNCGNGTNNIFLSNKIYATIIINNIIPIIKLYCSKYNLQK